VCPSLLFDFELFTGVPCYERLERDEKPLRCGRKGESEINGGG